ncbi:MAG: aminoacyl-histidine dipeptidase [Bacteroidaceae bacterium]|nr:aminoacyl-histidine dipeptidase [Bacteroidaceae bacterium]
MNQCLSPACVFEQFKKINTIPRPSKHEEKIIAFLKDFGEQRRLETVVDEVGNVLIRKPASKGYEDKPTVILQSHMDMVCEKLPSTIIDFTTDPIQTYIDGDWMKARGTTLGADDGIGCAMQLAILAGDYEHGPLECVFTRDEETGLTGAMGMESSFMTGDMLINLDSEDEGQIFVSCAGGITTTATFVYKREEAPKNFFFMKATLQGLTGGHSGDDINKKRANAIKLLARFLYSQQEKRDIRIAYFNSGRMHNAIPRDGEVVFAVPFADKDNVMIDWNIITSEYNDEFHVTEPGMQYRMESCDAVPVMPKNTSDSLIRSLQAVDNGIYTMCQDEAISWLVETSSNVASVKTTDTETTIVASQRSNVMSNLRNMANTIKACFQLAGAQVKQSDGYPAWKMNPDSHLTAVTVETYKRLFGKEPQVLGIHAGLECGLFSERYPNLDMVSIGPTMRGVHSPDEKLLIPTVQMVWNHLLEILKSV